MSTAELKTHLHQLVDGITDNSTLQAIYVLLTKGKTAEDTDWYDELPPLVKARLLESMQQAEKGEVIPHDQVMKQLSAKYPDLRF